MYTWKLFAVIVMLCLSTVSGCYYVHRHSPSYSISEGSAVGVIVFTENEGSALLLESALGSALLERGLAPVSLRSEAFIPELVSNLVIPENDTPVYSQIGKNGELQGDRETFMMLIEQNKFEESKRRFDDLIDLLSMMADKYELKHIMTVHQLNAYCYVASLIGTDSRKIKFTYFTCGNEGGWARKYPDPPSYGNIEHRSSDEDFMPYVFVQLSQDVASLIKVVKPKKDKE